MSDKQAAMHIINKCAAFNITVARYRDMNGSHWPRLTEDECRTISRCTILSYEEIVREFKS